MQGTSISDFAEYQKKKIFFQRSTNETLVTDVMLIFTFTRKYMS